jgi:hypothetical protein
MWGMWWLYVMSNRVQPTPLSSILTLKGLYHEMNIFLKDFENQWALSDWAPMVFKFLWSLAVQILNLMFLLTSMKQLLILKILTGTILWELVPAFRQSPIALTIIPKAACDLEKCSESRQWHAHFLGFFLHSVRVGQWTQKKIDQWNRS